MSNLLNKFADKLQGHDHENRDNNNNDDDLQQQQRKQGFRQGTRRKQESNSEDLYSGTRQGYEGVPSEDTGAYMHSGNTGRDRDSSRAQTKYSGRTGDDLEEADQDTFTSSGQQSGQRANRGVSNDWNDDSGMMGSGNAGMMGSGDNNDMMGSGNSNTMGGGNTMGGNRKRDNW